MRKNAARGPQGNLVTGGFSFSAECVNCLVECNQQGGKQRIAESIDVGVTCLFTAR